MFEINMQLFGGGGNSSGVGGGVKSILDSDGKTTIDLSDVPLKYGKLDKGLDKKSRLEVESFESKHVNDNHENLILVDEHGNVVAEKIGGATSVYASPYEYSKARTTSHNHPREPGMLGGTFSVTEGRKGDINTFVDSKNEITQRAVAKEGTYSMTKLNGFDGNGLLKATQKFRRKNRKEYRDTINRLVTETLAGKIKQDDYNEARRRAFNNYLVRSHNFFLENQSKYNYFYTLERRRRK